MDLKSPVCMSGSLYDSKGEIVKSDMLEPLRFSNSPRITGARSIQSLLFPAAVILSNR
jgi:hypothetical protein